MKYVKYAALSFLTLAAIVALDFKGYIDVVPAAIGLTTDGVVCGLSLGSECNLNSYRHNTRANLD